MDVLTTLASMPTTAILQNRQTVLKPIWVSTIPVMARRPNSRLETGSALEKTVRWRRPPGAWRSIHDQYRIAYLEGYVDWIERAMEDGCTVLGYFVWSTMDVYSWINGYKKRYGLVYIDYDSDDLVRIPKDSYYWYKNKIQNRRKSFNGKIHSIY